MPTISPEWIIKFPTYEAFEEYSKREYLMFNLMSYGSLYTNFDVIALYTRYIDYLGHTHPHKLINAYYDVFNIVDFIKDKCDYIIVSDHGCIDGIHTDKAFIGSNFPINANSIEEVRKDIERILKLKGVIKNE